MVEGAAPLPFVDFVGLVALPLLPGFGQGQLPVVWKVVVVVPVVETLYLQVLGFVE